MIAEDTERADFRRILVAVDGSEASAVALEHAVRLAGLYGGELVGLHVLDSGWPDFIGNDWQSSRGARQGFLDHVRREHEEQAEAARRQFELAAAGFAGARFQVLAGDPVAVLAAQLDDAGADLLVFGRRTFQVCGRPSLKTAATTLARQCRGAVLLLP